MTLKELKRLIQLDKAFRVKTTRGCLFIILYMSLMGCPYVEQLQGQSGMWFWNSQTSNIHVQAVSRRCSPT